MRWLAICVLLTTHLMPQGDPEKSAAQTESFHRRYSEGNVSHYLMTGDNNGWRYSIEATITVKR